MVYQMYKSVCRSLSCGGHERTFDPLDSPKRRVSRLTPATRICVEGAEVESRDFYRGAELVGAPSVTGSGGGHRIDEMQVVLTQVGVEINTFAALVRIVGAIG